MFFLDCPVQIIPCCRPFSAKLFRENELIWQEMGHMRGAHLKQQQIVSKLVQFLVTLVHPQKRLGKRHLLAIDELQTKKARLEGSLQNINLNQAMQTLQNNNISEPNRINEVKFTSGF